MSSATAAPIGLRGMISMLPLLVTRATVLTTFAPRPRRVVARGPRWDPGLGDHPGHEVIPALLGCFDLGLRDRRRRLGEGVQKDEQIPRAPIQDPVVVPAVVAAEFSELAFHLRRVGKRQWRAVLAAEVEAVEGVPELVGVDAKAEAMVEAPKE